MNIIIIIVDLIFKVWIGLSLFRCLFSFSSSQFVAVLCIILLVSFFLSFAQLHSHLFLLPLAGID